MLCVLFFCVFLWEKEHTLDMRLGLWDSLRSFFSHRTHRFNRPFLRTVSISQNASSIQISQNVTAKDGCNVLWYLSPLIIVSAFSLFAERLLSLCENLWEAKHATTQDVRWMASVPLWKSVRDRIHHEPRRIQKGFCSFVKLCERWNIQRALFKTKISVETNPTTTKESNTCKQGTRRALSWGKKGVFNTQGGHVLERWRASYRNV